MVPLNSRPTHLANIYLPSALVSRSSQSHVDFAGRNIEDAKGSHQEDVLKTSRCVHALLSQTQILRQESPYFLQRKPTVINIPSLTVKRKTSQAHTLSAEKTGMESKAPEKQSFLEKKK